MSPELARSIGGAPGLDDAGANDAPNANTISNAYAQNKSLAELDQPMKVYSEKDIDEREQRDNAQLSDKRSELEALQR